MSKKFIVAAIVAMLAFGATAMATGSRIETLGNQGDYLEDDTNIFGNPATLAYYQNCVLLHMGGAQGGDMMAFGGGSYGVSDELTIALIVARNPSFEQGGIGTIIGNVIDPTVGVDLDGDGTDDIFPGGFNVNVGAPLPGDPPNLAIDWVNPFDIILAYQMDDLAVGISYYMANGKLKMIDDLPVPGTDDTESYIVKARLHSIKLGASYDMDDMKVEGWFHWDPYSVVSNYEYDAEIAGADYDSEQILKGSKILLGGRVLYSMSDNVTIIPTINYSRTTGSVTVDTDPNLVLPTGGDEEDVSEDYTVQNLKVGAAAQYKEDKIMVIGSLGLLWSKVVQDLAIDDDSDYEYTGTEKYFAVPVAAMGIEYEANKILTIRGGLDTTTMWAANTGMEEASDNTGDTLDRSGLLTVQSTTAAIGVGLTFGNLVIDGTLGNMFLSDEDGSGVNLLSQLDMKYKF